MGSSRIHARVAGGILLWILVAGLLRSDLEAAMLSHALIQLPCLVAAGLLLVPRPLSRASDAWAVPLFLVALFAGAIWMLPRMLDASLEDAWVEVAKLVALPSLVGVPLGFCWPRLRGVARAFVWSNLVSMLLALGWLYIAAPMRVCSYYLLHEQVALGSAYLALAGAIVVAPLPRLFLGGPLPATTRVPLRDATPS